MLSHCRLTGSIVTTNAVRFIDYALATGKAFTLPLVALANPPSIYSRVNLLPLQCWLLLCA